MDFTLLLHEYGVDQLTSLLRGNLDPRFAEAFSRLDAVQPPEQLRRQLVELVGPRTVVDVVLSCGDLNILADLFAAAEGIEDLLRAERTWSPSRTSELATRIWQSTPADIARCLRSLRLLSPDVAMRIVPVDQSEAMLDYVLRDVPWVRRPAISADGETASEGLPFVRVDLIPIMLESFPLTDSANSTTQDPLNAALVGLGRRLLDCLPSIGRVEVVAVSPAGLELDSILSIGGRKSCRRANIHPPEATKWNVARRRFVADAVGVAPASERLAMEGDAAGAALACLDETVFVLLASGKPNRQTIERSIQTVKELASVAEPMPSTSASSSWLNDQSSQWTANERQDGDPIALSENVVDDTLRLAKELSGNVMPVASSLRKLANRLASSERWDELGITAPIAVQKLAVAVDHLAIIAAGLGTSVVELQPLRAAARRVGTRKKLPTSARFVRNRVEDNEAAALERLAEHLSESLSWSIAETIRGGDGDPIAGSSDDLILVVECDSVLHWLSSLEALSAAAREAELEHLTLVPMRNRVAIPQFSIAIHFGRASITQFDLPPDSLSRQHDQFELATQFGSIVWNEILRASLETCHPHPYAPNPTEQSYGISAVGTPIDFPTANEADSALIRGVQGWLDEVRGLLTEESAQPDESPDSQESVANQLMIALLDPESSGPVGNAAVTLAILLTEWEIDPAQAEADLSELLAPE